MAYGARLESVLGESPRGFESPILRHVISRDIVHICLERSFISEPRCGILGVLGFGIRSTSNPYFRL